MKAVILFLVGALVAGLAALFTGANDFKVTVDFLFTQVEWPLAMLLLVTFICGFLLAIILWLPSYLALRARVAFLRKENQAQREELKVLRASPLTEPD